MRIGMFLGLTLVFGAVWTAGAEAASTSAGEGDFIGPNDRVVFLGDSITHGGAYGEYVSLFYATRYPGSDRWFSNSGWSGASLPQGIASVDEDVVAKTPTVVTVFYGMNDSGSQESWPVDSPDYPGRSARKLREYETNYTNLLALIAAKAKSPRIVYVTPSPYDQTCNDCGKTVATRKNDVMGLMAEWVDKANVFRIGYESNAACMRNLVVRNLDVHAYSVNDRPLSHYWVNAIVWLQPSNGMKISDCLFSDIRIRADGTNVPLVIAEPRVCRCFKLGSGSDPYGGKIEFDTYTTGGSVENVVFRNVSVTGERGALT